MADEQLRGLNINQVYIDEAVGMFPDLTTYRTDWEIDAPRELVLVDYSNLEARWILPEPPAQYGRPLTLEALRSARNYGRPLTLEALRSARNLMQQANRIVRGRDTDTAEISARRDSINYLLGQMGITPAKTKEKKQEIKRGNPWVQ